MQTNIEIQLKIINCGIIYTIKPDFSKFNGDFGDFSGDFGDSGDFSKSSDPINTFNDLQLSTNVGKENCCTFYLYPAC